MTVHSMNDMYSSGICLNSFCKLQLYQIQNDEGGMIYEGGGQGCYKYDAELLTVCNSN